MHRRLHLLLLRYYEKRAKRFLDAGLPQIAIFSFDLVGSHVNLFGRSESEELDLLLSWLRQKGIKGVCIDVGANIGNHSICFADHFDEVFSFEPHPMLFKVLSVNASLKNNIHCFNFGASSTTQQMSLYIGDKSNLGHASIYWENETRKAEAATITLKPLDSVPEILEKKISFMKIDVEGHELEVLKGAERIIVRDRPAIAFEQHPDEILGDTSACIEFLRGLGYDEFYSFIQTHNFKNRLIRNIARLTYGYRMELRLISRFVPQFYPLIIARHSR